MGPPASVQPPCAPPLPCVGRREDKQQSAATARPATRRAGRVGSAAHAGCDLKGAVIWRRFWRPAAARTGTCGQPLFSAAKGVQILKWRQMRAFSGSLTEWCGRAVAARLLPQQPPSGRFLPGSCPVPARFLPDNRAAPASASVGRLLRRSRARGWAAQPSTGRTAGTLSLSGHGCCTTLVWMIPTTHTIPLRNLNQNQNTG